MMMNLWDEEKQQRLYVQELSREAAQKAAERERHESQKALERERKESQKALERERHESQKALQKEAERARQEIFQRCQLLLQTGKITVQEIPLFYPQLTQEDIENLKPFENKYSI